MKQTLRKSIDDPSAKKRKSVWKMFEVMDWAHKAGVFSMGEDEERGVTEVSEVTLDLEQAAEPIDETITAGMPHKYSRYAPQIQQVCPTNTAGMPHKYSRYAPQMC
jgi:hypothetical protein